MYSPEDINLNQKPEILLADCDISTRAFHTLRNAGINKLSDLTTYTEEELKTKISMINSKTFQEINELLSAYGLSLKS